MTRVSKTIGTAPIVEVADLPAAASSRVAQPYRLTQTGGGGEPPGLYTCEEDPDNPGTYDWVLFSAFP